MTPATSTDGAVGVPDGLRWYVAYVNPRSEKAVRDRLISDGMEAYVATRKEVHLWRRNERRVVEQVLISCVVFIRANEKSLNGLLKPYAITSFMRDAARKPLPGKVPYATVTDAEMQLLQSMLAQDEYEVSFAPSNFTVGEQVRVLGFDAGDQLAQIIHLPGDATSYVGLRVNFLGCAYMKVPVSRIVKLKK